MGGVRQALQCQSVPWARLALQEAVTDLRTKCRFYPWGRSPGSIIHRAADRSLSPQGSKGTWGSGSAGPHAHVALRAGL